MATGITLPAETNGELKKTSEWSLASLNSIAYGYEVGVTPLQIACAYAAVANGGILMRPYIVRRELDENGVEVSVNEPQAIRRVNPKEVNEKVRTMLRSVVEFGTGSSVKIQGVDIAGKTGTSRKYVDGKYETGSYNASFAGFFPADKPEIVCLVILEKPKTGYTGAIASAPIFKGIAERIIHNNGLLSKAMMAATPEPDNADDAVTVPNVAGMTVEKARTVLTRSGLAAKAIGSGTDVVRQYPAASARAERGSIIQLMTAESGDPLSAGSNVLPDLRGMSVRNAVHALSAGRYSVSIVGSGIVVNQFPNAGVPLKPGSKVVVMCEPKTVSTAQLY
jgi:membrane peptidoglycan carboxypeptidase